LIKTKWNYTESIMIKLNWRVTYIKEGRMLLLIGSVVELQILRSNTKLMRMSDFEFNKLSIAQSDFDKLFLWFLFLNSENFKRLWIDELNKSPGAKHSYPFD
jgi:hypothetical protein